ncbi:type I restriction enzyme S subunit [Kroppenstedtia sanguinis]|uniref:restriction endonuclease subunit S n=1 Tax=Kroppenstedtia sanguinis TaxID=1380684 RepID=UPI003D1D9B99
MSEWKAVSLEDISQIVGGGTPSKEKTEYWGGEIPWVTPTDVTRGKVRKLEFTENRITKIGLSESSAKLIPSGSILMTTRATIGECVINMIPMATNQGFTNFICNERVYNEYLYYALCRHKIDFERLGSGSTFKEVSKRTIRSFKVMLPPLPEQRKIAAILSSVDEVIEKTEAIIKQTETVKKGLMQQLLTRGIGHIRFKQTEIGEIPEEWEIKTLGQVTESSAFGPRFPANSYNEKGNYALLRTTDIKDNWEINYSGMPMALLPMDKFNKHVLQKGDLLVTRSGTCGLVCIFNEYNVPVIPGAFLIRFRLSSTVVPEFVRFTMMTVNSQARIAQMASGGVQKNLSGTNLKKLVLPIPPITEQKRIVKIINSILSKMRYEQQYLTQLQTLKKGLMQVLLTGKVRVKVDEREEVVVP